MTESQPKFKFKKRSKASFKKKQLRRTGDNDNESTTKNGSGAPTAEDVTSSSSVKVEDECSPSTKVAPQHPTSDDEEEPSALNTILAVERRRKILGTGRNRGVDAASLGKQTLKKSNIAASMKEESETVDSVRNKDLEERLKGTFAGGKLAGSNDMGGDDEGGILAKKHRKAMEEFIQSNLNTQESNASAASNNSEGGEIKTNASEAEKELYAELLTSENDQGDGKGEKEGDVGAGGAMMGGTGIAEVALPIDERIKALKETERAAIEYERARKARYGGGDDRHLPASDVRDTSSSTQKGADSSSLAGMVPMNFASGPGKRKRPEVGLVGVDDSSSLKSTKTQNTPNTGTDYSVQSSALPHSASSAGSSVQRSDVSTLGASYSHNFQLHTKEWVSRRRDERQVEIDAVQAQQEAEEGPAESRARVGFDMARKLAKGEAVLPPAGGASNNTGGLGSGNIRNEWDKKGGDKRSSDDRVWKTFMSKARNRR